MVPGTAPGPCDCTWPRGRGELVQLIVKDDGAGIPPEHAEKVFAPFFSTKSAPIGTGLGLATVRGIVERPGGHVCVQPRPGGGTVARVLLPRVYEAGAVAAPPPVVSSSSIVRRLVLVVDDDEAVRRLLANHLRSIGCRVLEASGGQEALRLAGKAVEPIDLLLTDVVMPDMDGWELQEALRGQQPGLPTLLMSAYGAEVLARHVPDPGEVELLAKPFRLVEAERRVREMLEEN
jgi:CheY-like chemotaxis protein